MAANHLSDGAIVPEASELAVRLAMKFEGFVSRPYLCPALRATVGFGATHYLDGRRVTLSDPPISRAAGERLLRRHIETTYLPAVLKLCPGADTPGRIAALVDICFNIGISALKASTLRKRVNAGEWDRVPAEFRKWNKGGGRVLRGLVLRREAEIALL